MKKILITGASGFIGSHLVELFIEKGYKVIAFDRYNTSNNWGWLENSKYKNDFEMVLGDIRDYDSVFNVVKKSNTVIHLAALIGIPYSYISPLAYTRTNIDGTYNILEASKQSNVDQTIITSTSEIYGTAKYIPIDELHPVNAQSPYAASKIAADQLALSYYRSYNLPLKIIRPFNTYGPRQSARAIIPTIIPQMLNKKKFILLGNTFTKRDLTYVSEVCSAFFEVFKCSKLLGETVNVGTNKSVAIKELVFYLNKILDTKTKIKIDKKRQRPKKSEVLNLVCNNKKLIKTTKWKTKINIKLGLERTLLWFQDPENLKNYKYQYNI